MQEGLKKVKSNKLDNISITAFRIISILNLLFEGPCNDKQINEKINKEIGGERELSKDTICIYLNTLRLLGCEITRPIKSNGFKYILKTHPFKLCPSKNEIDTLIEIRKYISSLCDWKAALRTDKLFSNLIDYFALQTRDFFLSAKKTSLKREITSENFFYEIKQLENYCKQDKIITLVYDSPESGEKNIIMKAEKISLENGAFYILGYSQELETSLSLRIDRILGIKSVSLNKTDIKPKATLVRYKVKETCHILYEIEENESIVEKNDDEFIIEAFITNKFKFFQKILSSSNKCIILSPRETKDEYKKKLEKMLLFYSDIGCA